MNLKLGISTCPNDTYIYENLIAGLYDSPFSWDVTFADVQTLNEMVLQGELDVAKVSCGVLAQMDERYQVLSCGGAMGYGCGPLLLSSNGSSFDLSSVTNLPGRNTTAALLFKYWFMNTQQGGLKVDYALFDAVYRDLKSRRIIQGVVIHEHRFTWKRDGLYLIQDLGAFWEASVHSPVPLGCAVAKRSLGTSVITHVEQEIRDSLALARGRSEPVTPFIREKAQIGDKAVIEAHIQMFVNDFSQNIGVEGAQALQTLLEVAKDS